MSPRVVFAFRTLVFAGAIGILGGLLLKGVEWHAGFALWIAALTAGLYALARKGPLPLPRGTAFFVFVALAFAASSTWRDSNWLLWINVFGTAAAFGFAAARARETSVVVAPVGEYLRGWLGSWVCAFADFWALVFRDVRWGALAPAGASSRLKPALLGTAIALPILVLFGGLLSGADAVFASYVEAAFDWSEFDPFGYLGAMFLATWFAGSLYRRVLLAEDSVSSKGFWTRSLMPPALDPPVRSEPPSPAAEGVMPPPVVAPAKPPRQPFSLGITEIAIVLGSLNLMFLVFVAIQVRYLFGGDAVVQTVAGLTYADYARRGFFELVWVFALALPLLLWLASVFRNGKPSHSLAFQGLVGVTCGLLFAMMGSAVFRMLVYVEAYGLTDLRLYTTAFMCWLGLALLWFLLTNLRGVPERFAFGAIVAGFATMLALNVLNPDALIARTNMDRVVQGESIDLAYLTSLSADAWPTIVERIDALEPAKRGEVLASLRSHLKARPNDFRSWNLGIATAHGSLQNAPASR